MTDFLREKPMTKEYSFFSIIQSMGRRRGMPETDGHRAIGMLEGGTSVNAVAISFGVHRSTILRLSERHRATGWVLNRPRSGRPKGLTVREERYLRLTSRRDPFLLATRLTNRLITAVGVRVSAQTVIIIMTICNTHYNKIWRFYRFKGSNISSKLRLSGLNLKDAKIFNLAIYI